MARSTRFVFRQFRLLLLAVGCAIPSASWAAGDDGKPNIVVILADDMGYGDIGVHGCQDIPTPHIDSIAKNGVFCTNGYVTGPHCSPTRAALMAGRYQQRFGHGHNKAFPGSQMPVTELTLADRLSSAGYVTGLVGKWHLGSDETHHPMSRGFQEFFGFLGGANRYLPLGKSGTVPRILRGWEEANEKDYLTDAFTREAVAFIDRHQREPFFLYLAYNAVHGPLQAPPKYLKRFESIEDEDRRTYAAMLSALDDGIGEVLETLRAAGLEENTLVFFLSDNGGPVGKNGSQNTPLSGVKGDVREGGIRVPFLVQWKGHLPAGREYDQPVIQMDIHATALAVAGLEPPAHVRLDGVNLLPYLADEKSEPPHEALYWRFQHPLGEGNPYKWAIRQGDWKLFQEVKTVRTRRTDGKKRQITGESTELMLVNLAGDIDESENLAEQHPEKVEALRELWNTWNAELIEPGTRPTK